MGGWVYGWVYGWVERSEIWRQQCGNRGMGMVRGTAARRSTATNIGQGACDRSPTDPSAHSSAPVLGRASRPYVQVPLLLGMLRHQTSPDISNKPTHTCTIVLSTHTHTAASQ